MPEFAQAFVCFRQSRILVREIFSVTACLEIRLGRQKSRKSPYVHHTGVIMKNLTTILTAALLFSSFAATAARADTDELFSEINSGSVFNSTADGANGGSKQTGKRIRNGEDLRELLKSAGFDARAAGSRVATSEKKLEPWTFPMLAELSEDESTVTIVLGLATVKDVGTELSADRLLKMMTVSRQQAPSMIVYNADRKRTEICRTMDNRNLTGDELRRIINRMAVLAKDNSAMWASAGQQNGTPVANSRSTTPTSPVTPPATAPKTPVASASTLQGKWAASRSASEAFGIEFRTDSTFNLVYVNNGKQSKSSGRFTVTATSLQLTGNDGLKLSGTLTMKSATEFRFEPTGSAAMEFRKAQ